MKAFTPTPKSLCERSLPRFPFAKSAPTFFPSPRKISGVQGSQVLNGHLEDLRLLQLPGTLQKEEGLLAATQRAQANPGRLGARFYLEQLTGRCSGSAQRAAWCSLGARVPRGKSPQESPFPSPDSLHPCREWQQRIPSAWLCKLGL